MKNFGNYSRRDFGKAVLSTVPVAAVLGATLSGKALANALGAGPVTNSTVNGIKLGTISFSFKELKRNPGDSQWQEVLNDCQECGLSYLEIETGKVEPIPVAIPGGGRGGRGGGAAAAPETPATGTAYGSACPAPAGAGRGAGGGAGRGPATPMTPDEIAAAQAAAAKVREDTRQWRLTTPASYYANIKKQANDAGIQITSYTCGWGADYTDAEIDAIFNAAKALGASAINSSTTRAMAERLAPFADKHQFNVAFHGHTFGLFDNTDDYASVFGLSKYYRANLDIGHFTAACGDAVAFLKLNHDKVTTLHVKDYKTQEGPSMPWGTGDTPIKPVLQYLKSVKFPGVVEVEYDYPIPEGSNSIAEVKKCVQYMKDALA
jgi:sugar phosphate isomerase/epimerase